MKKRGVGLIIVAGCFFLLGFFSVAHATLVLDEPFDNLNNWTDGSIGGTFEISPAGYLHQMVSAGTSAKQFQNIGTIGSGDYTVEFRYRNDAPGNGNQFITINAGAEQLYLWFGNGSFLKSFNGSWQTLITQDFTDDYHVVRLMVHTNQAKCHAYFDGVLQNLDVACGNTTGTDGVVDLFVGNGGGECHMDYIKIYDGEESNGEPDPIPEPGTMMLLGSLATGLFGITRVRKRRKGGKSMKKLTLMSIILIGGLLMASISAQANTFAHPPEGSGQQWATQYPYQRNILWTFDWGQSPPEVDPQGFLEGAGYPDYTGYDDPTLYPSDYVWVSDEIQYFETFNDGLGNIFTGVIGIDNRGGTAPITGSVVCHIDNWDIPNDVKHLWKEITYAEAPGLLSDVTESLLAPQGYASSAPHLVYTDPLAGLLRTESIWYSIEPNPEWEEIVLNFTASPGYYAIVDSLHVATECVPIPEPTTMILLGSLATGLFGIAAVRRKRG